MADTYEKDLAQKSSLTTSDFIRVVGSDNVSYKQLVSDVADKVLTLGKSASTTGTVSDLDALVPFTTGYATFDASVSPTGASGAFWYSVIGWGSNTRTEITCVDVSGTVYTRVKDYSGWKTWVKQPTRAEVDALNSNKAVTANYTSVAINNLKSEFSTYATGFSTHIISTSTGPNYMALVYKLSNSYGCAILMTYATATDANPAFVQLQNGTWTDGISLR